MSKNIRKLCVMSIVLALALASCASPAKSNITLLLPTADSNVGQSLPLDSISINESGNEHENESEGTSDSHTNRIEALDAEFEASTPEPDGSTASMMAYAEAYLELWQVEVEALLTAKPSLADDFNTFEAEVQKELDALAAQYQSDDGEVYGSAVSYELTWYRATALRDWLIEYYS